MRDINSFKERFQRWKKTGELPYEAGRIKNADSNREEQVYEDSLSLSALPAYEEGKDGTILNHDYANDVFTGARLFDGQDIVVTGHRRPKPFKWTTSRTKQLQPSELMSPLNVVGDAIENIPIIGHAFNEYVSPTLALGNWIVGKGNPYTGAEIRGNDERQLGAYLPLDFFIGPKIIKQANKYTTNFVSPQNIYKGMRFAGIPQVAAKEILQSPKLAYKRFKNLDMFDKIRGIEYTDDVYHGSHVPFDINNARTYSAKGGDSGLHLGSSPTPAYSRANGIQGGTLYKGKLKLKEAPFEVRDLGRWTYEEIGGEAYNNPAFKEYLTSHGIDIDQLLQKGWELEKEYTRQPDGPSQARYLQEHGGFESDKYLAKLFKDHGINLKYKNEFETFKNVPEYSYAIYDPSSVVWDRHFRFSEKPQVLKVLNDLGIAKNYGNNTYHIDFDDLYNVLQYQSEFRLPTIK